MDSDNHSQLSRRAAIKRGLLGGALLTVAGAVPLALRKTHVTQHPTDLKYFTAEEYAVFAAVAERFLPGGENWLSASALDVPRKVDGVFALADAPTQRDVKQLLALFDNALASFLLDGRATPFTQLSLADQDRALEQWRTSRLVLRRSGFDALRKISLAVYYADPATWPGVGYPGPPELAK